MLKIALCDDMERDRNAVIVALKQIEDKWSDKFEVAAFSNGEVLCDDIEKNYYDIILLDIQMNGIDGIETATRIKSINPKALIIFISSYDDRLKELFSFRTIAFIDKPVSVEALEKALLDANEIIKKENELIFSYSKDGSTLYIPIKDIMYFESRRNIVLIHTNTNEETFYSTLTSVWKQVKDTNQFIMSHRSFIFNLKYVNIKSDNVIIKETGEHFKIGIKHKEDTQERYLNYIEKSWYR